MTIQINTDKHIDGNERLAAHIKDSINHELSHFSDHITRVEVHLADENGGKTGVNDKRCILEARMENRQPIAVTSHAKSVELALQEALTKLRATMGTIVSKLKDH